MPNVKTAVSIEKPLFDQAEDAAREMNVSRSELYELALAEFLERRQSTIMLRELNEVYGAGEPDLEQDDFLESARRALRRIVEGEW